MGSYLCGFEARPALTLLRLLRGWRFVCSPGAELLPPAPAGSRHSLGTVRAGSHRPFPLVTGWLRLLSGLRFFLHGITSLE